MRRRAFMAATAGALPAGFVVATQAAMADDASDKADDDKGDVAAAGQAREAALKVL